MEGDRDVETDACRVLRRFYFVLLLWWKKLDHVHMLDWLNFPERGEILTRQALILILGRSGGPSFYQRGRKVRRQLMGNWKLKGFSSDHIRFYCVTWEWGYGLHVGQLQRESWSEALRRRWTLEMVHRRGRRDLEGPREGLPLSDDNPDTHGDHLLVYQTVWGGRWGVQLTLMLVQVSCLERHVLRLIEHLRILSGH